MKYKVVKLLKEKEEYKNKGLIVGYLGIMINEAEEGCLVLFFNPKNQGDYLITTVNKNCLEITDITLPQDVYKDFDEFINSKNKTQKVNFSSNPFNECDYVELVVNKEKYLKYGLKKGDKGVVASNKVVKNKILVDFGCETEDFDGFMSVDFEDLKKARQ